MANTMLLIVKTALRRYAVRHDDLLDIKMVASAEQLSGDMFDRPVLGAELGALCDPADQSALVRRHALIVPLRRKYIALLVDSVETFLERAQSAPLPAILRERLSQPWAVGALSYEDELVVQLDIRAIARSVLLDRSHESGA
jgi:hypothetical protein